MSADSDLLLALRAIGGEPHLTGYANEGGVVGDVWVITREERNAILRVFAAARNVVKYEQRQWSNRVDRLAGDPISKKMIADEQFRLSRAIWNLRKTMPEVAREAADELRREPIDGGDDE